MPSLGVMPNRPSRNVNSSALEVGIEIGERALDALRLAGRARRVVHRRAGGAVVGHRGRLRVDRVGERRETGDGAVREPVDRRDARLVGRGRGDLGVTLVADEHLRVGVLEDVRDLRRREAVVDRHVVEAGLQRGQVHVHRVRAVGEHRGNRVAPLHPERPQGVNHLVGAGEDVAGRVLGAVGIDDREVAGILLRVLPKAHSARPPRSRTRFQPGQRSVGE